MTKECAGLKVCGTPLLYACTASPQSHSHWVDGWRINSELEEGRRQKGREGGEEGRLNEWLGGWMDEGWVDRWVDDGRMGGWMGDG